MAREASPSNEQAFFDSSRAFLSTASTATSWRRLRLRFYCFVLCLVVASMFLCCVFVFLSRRVDGLSLFSRGGGVSMARWPLDGALLLNLSVLSRGGEAASMASSHHAIDATL